MNVSGPTQSPTLSGAGNEWFLIPRDGGEASGNYWSDGRPNDVA